MTNSVCHPPSLCVLGKIFVSQRTPSSESEEMNRQVTRLASISLGSLVSVGESLVFVAESLAHIAASVVESLVHIVASLLKVGFHIRPSSLFSFELQTPPWLRMNGTTGFVLLF